MFRQQIQRAREPQALIAIQRKAFGPFSSGHNMPRNDLIKDSLSWLDQYLGPTR
jgi:hypothetical protein